MTGLLVVGEFIFYNTGRHSACDSKVWDIFCYHAVSGDDNIVPDMHIRQDTDIIGKPYIIPYGNFAFGV